MINKNFNEEIPEVGEEGLTQAVILQAVYDYRYSQCRLKKIEGKHSKWYDTNRVAMTNLLEKTKAYFLDDDFEYVSNINGEWLMNELDKQLEQCDYDMDKIMEDCLTV